VQLSEELFTKFSLEILRCEEVCVLRNLKNAQKRERPPMGAAFVIEREPPLKTLLGQRSF
jgi:hypothetical protein